MELTELITALGKPAAYPFAVDAIEVRQTHISVVFLSGAHVYKIKKPVALGFLDFSTLALREHFCREEVRLNNRLAPGIYQGVVPVTNEGGRVCFEGPGEPIEWAVKMVRLPEDATLEHRLQHDAVDAPLMDRLAKKIAAFHQQAESGPQIAACGKFDVVAGNARENLTQSTSQIGHAISHAVFDRLQALLETTLEQQRELIDQRATRGVPRDTHGDLRPDHVYLLDGPSPADNVAIIDCIEFNERFRFADPVADVAFLLMGLQLERRGDLARALADAYFRAAGDEEGRRLLPLYTSYRAAVRGKVEGLKAAEPEVPEAERAAALAQARRCWLLALAELETPGKRPAMLLIGGLPGTGKSTLAAELADQAGFSVVRSDMVRKELAGVDPGTQRAASFEHGIYSRSWTDETYAECLRRTEQLLFEGQRVIVDASFREDARRREFLQRAAHWSVPALVLICEADPATVRRRLAQRKGDVSDADWAIYQQKADRWEPPGDATRAAVRTIRTDDDSRPAIDQVRSALGEIELET